jgi:hypothetical protein
MNPAREYMIFRGWWFLASPAGGGTACLKIIRIAKVLRPERQITIRTINAKRGTLKKLVAGLAKPFRAEYWPGCKVVRGIVTWAYGCINSLIRHDLLLWRILVNGNLEIPLKFYSPGIGVIPPRAKLHDIHWKSVLWKHSVCREPFQCPFLKKVPLKGR